MKKLSLKPLGGICMKTLCKSLLFIGLLTTFGLSACSDDDDDAVTPIFPEKQNLICNAGDTREFTFTANTNWSLASSAIWCKFKTDDMEEFIMSGTAGTQTVTLLITDDNQKVGNTSVAKLELTMGGQTIVIGEITRSLVDYELTIYDKDGNEISDGEALNVGYREFAQFSVKANFRFAATNLPGWVDLEGGAMVGAVNQQVKGGLKIIENESREKYPVGADEGNVITFSDDEGRAFRSVKLSYEGMAPGAMELTRPSTNQYDWVVSLDGKTFTHGGSSTAGTGSSNTTFRNRLPFTVKTLKDDYEVVFVEKGWDGNLWVIDQSNPYELWMSYEDKNAEGKKDGHIKLTVNEYVPEYGASKERTGYVLVFSRAEYESIKDDLQETIINGEEIVYKYSEANLVLQFTQKEIKEENNDQGFVVLFKGTDDTPCTKVTDTEVLAFLQSNYSVGDVYSISANAKETYVINPLISGWEANNDYIIIDAKGQDVKGLGLEGYMVGEDMALSATLPDSFNEDIFIIFQNASGVNVKALMIISNVGGGEQQQKFVVTNGTAPEIYNESNAQSLIEKHGLTSIYKTTASGSVDIEMAPSEIESFKVFDLEGGDGGTDITSSSSNDCGWGVDDFGNTKKGKINIWFGQDSSLENKTVLIVVTCQNDEIYGIVVSK